MKRFDPAIVFGFLLIVGGVLALAQTMGILENASFGEAFSLLPG